MSAADDILKLTEGWTITKLLRRNAIEHAELPALTDGIGPNPLTFSWSRLRAEVAAFTHGLADVGLRANDRMLIMMTKRPEHWVADLAATHLGAIPCTTYDTLSSDQIRFVARHSAAPVIVAEGAEQLGRLLPVIDDLPALRRVIVVEDAVLPAGDARFVGYEDVWERGGARRVDLAGEFERLTDAVQPRQPLCMIYTSGTTGDPKGVVLTHHNAVYQATMFDQTTPLSARNPRSVAYLPLAHIAERMLGIYLPIGLAGHVTICADPAQLVPTLRAVRPHGFFGVPRVWEKVAAAVQGSLAALPAEQRAALGQARELALAVYRLRAAGSEVPAELVAKLDAVDPVALRPIRESLGLAESERNSSGAAPIPIAVLEFLASLGLMVTELWGLSETTGGVTLSRPDLFAPGTVGAAVPGMELKIAEDGEILVRGPIVFAGYLQEDGSIRPDTDADGWLATGDIGTLDDRGLLSITDRKKELIITSGGKNIGPAVIEGKLRQIPAVSQAVVIGDRRNYLVALLTLDPARAAAEGQTAGSPARTPEALATCPVFRQYLEKQVEGVNATLARYETIKKFVILPRELSIDEGELTPTMKLKRRVVNQKFADEIERLYAA